MAINRIQFQTGLSFRAFQAAYGIEEQCLEAMIKAKWPDGFHCPRCGGGAAYFVTQRRLFQCKACRHQTPVMVGTVCESSHLPLRTWFEAMYRLSQGKHSISTPELKRCLGVRYPTTYYLKQKILCATDAAESGRTLQNRHEPIKSEGGWRGSKTEAFQAVNTVISNMKGNILGVCRWYSTRHLPRYLAEFQFRFNNRFDLKTIFPALLVAVVRTAPHPVSNLVAEACG